MPRSLARASAGLVLRPDSRAQQVVLLLLLCSDGDARPMFKEKLALLLPMRVWACAAALCESLLCFVHSLKWVLGLGVFAMNPSLNVANAAHQPSHDPPFL